MKKRDYTSCPFEARRRSEYKPTIKLEVQRRNSSEWKPISIDDVTKILLLLTNDFVTIRHNFNKSAYAQLGTHWQHLELGRWIIGPQSTIRRVQQ